MIARRIVLLGLVIALGIGLGRADLRAQGFQTSVPQAILIDAATRTVLFEKAADELAVPASLVKVMTANLIFEEITQGRLSLTDEMTVSENAWRKGGAPSGGSAMFAALSSRIKVEDLLRGLVIQSGNDAAIVLAEGLAGNEPTFAARMTRRARELGLERSTFRNATGLPDPDQKVTAREMATLALHTIETYPELYKLYGEREFTWNKIRQQNRNPLLTMEIGADGLKTGNVDDSGYGLIGSAVQDGQRLVVVVMGAKNARDRANEARKLLDWGFRAFETRTLFEAGETVGEAILFGGDRSLLELVSTKPVKLLLPRGANERFAVRIVYQGPIQAPVAQGAQVASLRVQRGEAVILDTPLYAKDAVATGPITRRAWDAAFELASQWLRRGVAAVLEQRP